MRQLVPTMADVDPLSTYLAGHRPPPVGRPWVVVGMITSLDGASAVDGRSGALGGPADKVVFRAVRAVADVILVGAGTVRAEGYRPVTLSDRALALRADAGRGPEAPRLAIVTGTCDLDLDGPLFAGPRPPIVLTTDDADPARVRAASARTEVRPFGSGRVDLPAAVASLAVDGAEVVVCEGGPSLNGALADADMIDELCLTVAPLLAGGDSTRIQCGSVVTEPAAYELASLLTEDGLLFGRWVRTVSRPGRTAGGG